MTFVEQLIEFTLRLAFGLTAAMALLSPKQVVSGFFRNHLYVALGLHALAAVCGWPNANRLVFWLPLAGVMASYLGAAAWLYEAQRLGRVMIGLVCAISLLGAWSAQWSLMRGATGAKLLLTWLDPVLGGLLLGTVFAAMLLGHWYLNTPTMSLGPLRKLLKASAVSTLVRAGVALAALAMLLAMHGVDSTTSLLILLRWAAGIVAVLGVCWMAWKTLEIPNTQSATGILYVGVIVAFLGELAAQLLAAQLPLPV